MGSACPLLLFQWGRETHWPQLHREAVVPIICPPNPRSLVGVHTLSVGSVNLVSVWFSDIPAASAIVSETQELHQEGEREGVR